jgi:hypothetical protein
VSQAQVFEWSHCFKEGHMSTIVTNILGTLQPIETVSSMTWQRGLTNCELAKLGISVTCQTKKKQQVLSTIVLMLDVITSFNFLFFPNDGLKK